MSADNARYIMAASSYGFTVSGALIVVRAGGAAVVGLQHHVFPRWLSIVAAVTAARALLGIMPIIERDPTGPLSTIASLAWIGLFVWILGTATVMLRRTDGHDHERHDLARTSRDHG